MFSFFILCFLCNYTKIRFLIYLASVVYLMIGTSALIVVTNVNKIDVLH